MGVQCALCHSTVDDSFAPGIGKRLDGWANRDLNVGLIVSLRSNLTPIADLLRVDVATVKAVLNSWARGASTRARQGRQKPPSGRRAGGHADSARVRPRRVNLHTWTGFGSVPYWNAYVAVTEMHGSGTFFDQRLSDPVQYPVSARSGSWNTRGTPDLVTARFPRFMPISSPLKAPRPPVGSFDAAAAERGKEVFDGPGSARPATFRRCNTEPGPQPAHARGDGGRFLSSGPLADPHVSQPPRSRDCGRTRRAVSFHDGRFATCGTSSSTTTSTSDSG